VSGPPAEQGPRPVLERALDLPQRLALRVPWSPDARIAIRGVFGFLKQIARSRALGLSARPPEPRVFTKH
jgi:hypothetical protein